MIKNKIIEQLIRVDHAGEYGAIQIYTGQLKIFKKDQEIKHMLDQEEEHLAFFSRQLLNRKIRPTLLMPIWKVAGFCAGFMSAAMGKKAAMACTIAVEETIDSHYSSQVKMLSKFGWEGDLCAKIEKFREEELEHRDLGIHNKGQEAFGYQVLSRLTSLGCRAAIFIAKHL